MNTFFPHLNNRNESFDSGLGVSPSLHQAFFSLGAILCNRSCLQLFEEENCSLGFLFWKGKDRIEHFPYFENNLESLDVFLEVDKSFDQD